MPRTRSQAVESPLVSLDTPRRRRRATTTARPSVDAPEATAVKSKRGRKPTKKETVLENPSEEITRNTSETQSPRMTHTQAQEIPSDTQGDVPMDEIAMDKTATDNGSTIPVTPKREIHIDIDTPSVSSKKSTRSLFSSAKKEKLKLSLSSFKQKLKEKANLFERRLDRLRNHTEPNSAPQIANVESAPSTNYALAEAEILDAALEILINRMDTASTEPDFSTSSHIRCPCCQNPMAFTCPENHNMQSWIPDEMKNVLTTFMNGLLTSILTEGIILSEEKENDLQAEEELEVKGTLQAEEQRKPAPQNKNKKAESPSKRKGKKRARDLQDDEGHDEAPSAQRPRLTNSAGRTPYRRRLTTPRRKLPFSEINRRVNEREQGLSSPSMFHLDQIVAQHEADEKAEKARREAAEAAAEVERLESISRAAMERHAVLGPIPENLQNSFEVPVFNDGRQDLNMAEAQIAEAPETPEALELPETPTPNSGWGVGIRNIFSSVTGSVRRFVPNFRHGADEAVPFVAGGDATAMAANDTAVRPVETNGNEGSGTTMDLTYSLFPPTFDVPQTLPESRPVTASAATENGTVHAADKETTQPSGQNLDNGEHKDATDQEPEPKSAGKKRKRDRPPTPDIIPNPPGCSYGLHDDWFVYSDDEIEEAEAYCAAQEAAAAAAASTTEPATPVAERPEKRARFLSPVTEEDSSAAQAQETTREWLPTPPGWARPTTTVYTGTMFKGMTPIPAPKEDLQEKPDWLRQAIERKHFARKKSEALAQLKKTHPESGSILDLRKTHEKKRTTTTLATPRTPWEELNPYVNPQLENPGSPRPLRMRAPYPMSRESNQQPAVNPNSHYEPAPKEQAAAVNGTSLHLPQQQDAAVNGTSLHLPQQQDAAVNGTSAHPPHRHPDATNAVPTTPSATVERTSLPPIIQPISASKGQPATDGHRPNNPSRLRNAMRLSSSPMSQPSPTLKLNESNQQDLLQVFGNDEFGRQAYDIYQSCPSGDLGHLQWPGFESIQDQQHIAGNQQNEDFQFKGSFEHFRTEFDRGLLNPDEILSDLPL